MHNLVPQKCIKSSVDSIKSVLAKDAKKQKRKVKLPLSDTSTELNLPLILCLKAKFKYVEVYTHEGMVDSVVSLITYEARYSQLMRVHRNALINPIFITKLVSQPSGVKVILSNGVGGKKQAVSVSRRHVASVRKYLRDEGKS